MSVYEGCRCFLPNGRHARAGDGIPILFTCRLTAPGCGGFFMCRKAGRFPKVSESPDLYLEFASQK